MAAAARIVLAVGLISAVSSQACAADASGNVEVIGAGLLSCGAWTESRRAQAEGPARQWVFGYLTAVADQVEGMDPLHGVDPAVPDTELRVISGEEIMA